MADFPARRALFLDRTAIWALQLVRALAPALALVAILTAFYPEWKNLWPWKECVVAAFVLNIGAALFVWYRDQPSKSARFDTSRARFAITSDARDLFSIAKDADLDALETTPPQLYRKWIAADPQCTRVFEDFVRNKPNKRRLQGYYTVFILKEDFFQMFIRSRTGYDEIKNENVVRLSTHAIDPEPASCAIIEDGKEKLTALIFDMGARNQSLGPAYSRWMIADLVWRVDHLINQNSDVSKIAIFSTNTSSSDLAKYFDMADLPVYRNEKFPEWKIYATDRSMYLENIRRRKELASLFKRNIWSLSYTISFTDRKTIGDMTVPLYNARVKGRRAGRRSKATGGG